jgi:DNA-binding transcriptional MocR family regulator
MPRTPIDRLGSAHPNLLWFARGWFASEGIAASSLAVVAGSLDGLERVLGAHLRIGDRVLIEDPAYPPIRDLLQALGLVASPVAVDERGLVPAALAAGLARGASALVYVPRGQNPTGAALDDERALALRAVLAADPELLVIEDDHVSLVSGAPLCSALAPERSRWAIIRALSKLLHPDLRVALLAGDETTIARVEGRQALGTRWVSHLLQETAATMLTDVRFQARCTAAGEAYRERRKALIGALAQRSIRSMGSSGLNVWVPVHEEAPVVRALGDAGFLVLAGERFRIASPPGIRITAATLRDGEPERIAIALADALQRSGGQLGRF